MPLLMPHRLLAALLLASLLSAAPPLSAEEESGPDAAVLRANAVLAAAGLPPLPQNTREMLCYSWNGLSAGIYAAFPFKEKTDFDSYLAALAPGLEKASPIPASLLAPPNPSAPWFTPGDIKDGAVFFRGRIVRAAPEMLRLYADSEQSKCYLYYTWNNKRTYP